MRYLVTLSVQAKAAQDYVKLGSKGIEEYGKYVFTDIANKMNVLATSGRVVTKLPKARALDDEGNVASSYSFEIEAENEKAAAYEAYDWVLSWRNTHGVTPDIDVVSVRAHVAQEIQPVAVDPEDDDEAEVGEEADFAVMTPAKRGRKPKAV